VTKPFLIRRFFLLHMRPNHLPGSTLRYTHTWGLGGMAALLVTTLVLTGLLQILTYEPTPDHAYQSIIELEQTTLFGNLVRGIHHWSANLLIAVVLLHLLRVLFTGALTGPRRFNWIIGLGLLIGVLAANFTGYLLPWDQLSYWAVTICTGMLGYIPGIGGWLQTGIRGGAEVGPNTLLLFYSIHTALVPAILVLLMGFHFWRIRKARGVVLPRAIDEVDPVGTERVQTWPDLLLREAVVGMVLLAVVLLLAVVETPELGTPANPGMSPNPAKAPWYFVGFQELQIQFHPVIAVLVIPVLAMLGLGFLPYRRWDSNPEGIWFGSRIGRRTAWVAAATALFTTPLLIVASEWWIQPTKLFPSWPLMLSNGLLPFSLIMAAVTAFFLIIRHRFKGTRDDAIQAVIVLLIVSFIVLTVTALWFRGEGMVLSWPWGNGA